MRYINYNGKIIEASTPILIAENRGLRYGDGLFETLKFKNNKLIFANEHLARLWKGMQLLEMNIPALLNPERLEEMIIILIKKNKQSDARLRLTIIRGNGGLYDGDNNAQFIIESWPLIQEPVSLNENGLQVCIYEDALKICDRFSNLKHNNYLPYVMGALFAKKNKCNDAIILNQYHRICDSTIANIFMVKDGKIFTPALAEGCVAGIIRKFFLQQIPVMGYEVFENGITVEQLNEADEIFLTNSMYTMKWIASIDEKKYKNTICNLIFQNLSQTNPAEFCL